MSPETSPNATNRRAAGHKVQNGRVERSKAKKELNPPTYRIGGRTFACEACKKGHRVSKCTHASERPVSMTNDPGRPSGDQKRHCDCPRQCSCTKKNCKCDRSCSCTQTMYMLVYVPMKDGEASARKGPGEWKIGEEVTTDLHGKKLTEEEIKVRNELKQMQQVAKSSASTPGLLKPSPTAHTDSPTKSCCQHKKNIEEQRQPIPVKEELAAGQRRPQCNCGTGCACAFCLDHPNNQTSHLLAQEQATHFSNQTYGQQQLNPSWAPLQVEGSCMGTNPRFAISHTPNPSQSQFQTLFPAAGPASQGGYFISYPFTRYPPFVQSDFAQPMHSPTVATPLNAVPSLLTPSERLTSAPSLHRSASSCCHASTDADFPAMGDLSSADPFDFSGYDIGNAVASGWNSIDRVTFDQAFDVDLPPFPDDPAWQLANMGSTPDIGASIPDAETIEPHLMSSTTRPNVASDILPIAPKVPPDLASPAQPQCLHQSCCQHGAGQLHPHFSHQNHRGGLGMPLHNVPTPIMHSIYTHSPP